MNVQLQGVYVYGGSPQHHSVFRGQELRDRHHMVLKAIVALLLTVLFAWCVYAACSTIAAPPQAKAETASAQAAAQEAPAPQADTDAAA